MTFPHVRRKIPLKSVEEITVCVIDYGSFECVAEKLAETAKKVYYHSPFEEEFLDLQSCVTGYGLKNVERLDQPLDPNMLGDIDLFVFPDRGFGGLQRHLREIGKPVWGSMGFCEYEESRTKFLKLMKQLELPTVESVTIRGVTKLSEHLKTVKDKWVKINRYRQNMETWHHIDYTHSQQELAKLAVTFGGAREEVVFLVQDTLKTPLELGYDGWCIDGQYPTRSFQGYELKNELYLGSWMENDELPEVVREINEAMSPILKKVGYRNFFATELRILNDTPYFIDPTLRMPGQTGEHQFETCTNLPEVIWKGANGEVVAPKFSYKFAAEATLHYTEDSTSWKIFKVPESVQRWVKMYHYCIIDGICHFPPHKTDELGVVIGLGNTIETAIDQIKEHMEVLKHEPVKINMTGFAELITDIKKAEKDGIHFSDKKIPDESIVL